MFELIVLWEDPFLRGMLENLSLLETCPAKLFLGVGVPNRPALSNAGTHVGQGGLADWDTPGVQLIAQLAPLPSCEIIALGLQEKRSALST
jgi:hypothetical protein